MRATFIDPRTVRQRARIVAQLEGGPKSAKQIGEAIHLTNKAVLLHIRDMRAQGIVRVAGHADQVRSREIPLYGLGSEPDAKYVKVADRPENDFFEVQREKVRSAILAQLKISRATAPELSMLLGLSNPTLRKYLPRMKSMGLVHRSAWVARGSGGSDVAIWAAGDAPDAPKSKRVKRNNPMAALPDEQRELLRRKREAKSIVKHARRTPQGIFAALGI